MTDTTKTLIAALLDRSGSMHAIADDMRGGFDAFIEKQKAPTGTTLVTLAQFDDEYDLVYRDTAVEAVPPLTLEPRSRTALLDAIGRFVTEVGAGLSALPEDDRPGEVTVLVMTDGLENASTEWTVEGVRTLIAQQEKVYAWDFVFLGANMDAVEVGRTLGFAPGKSLTYDAEGDAVHGAWAAVSTYTARKRSPAVAGQPAASIVFDEAERRGARKRR